MLSDIFPPLLADLLSVEAPYSYLRPMAVLPASVESLGTLLPLQENRETWRISFILGMMTAGILVVSVAPELIQVANGRNLLWFGIGGFLVGLGSRMMNGCTSGHGICGVSRLSKRSLSAVITFMVIGAITVHFTKLLGA